MRVSDSLLYRMTQSRLRDARERNAVALGRAASGLRVEKPSDDPVASALSRRESNRITRAESIMEGIDAGVTHLQVADSALDQTSALLTRARELAIEAGNDTLSASDRAAIASEIAAIRAQVISRANAQAGDTYVFGGFIDNAPPFDAAGNYTGDNNVRQLEVAPGVRVDTGVSGDSVFGVSGGTNILQTLDDLTTALNANDGDAVRGSLSNLEAANSQVIAARSRLGASMNAFDTAKNTASRVRDQAVERRAQLIEIDPIDAFSELSRAEQALQAAVVAASRLPVAGLIDI